MPVNDFTRYRMSWRPSRDALGPGPKYLALAAALERDVASGTLPPGTRLPPQRELADFLDIDFTTVTRAFSLCSAKGILKGVVGRGTFVAGAEGGGGEEVGEAARADLGVVRAFPDIGAAEAVEAGRKLLASPGAAELFSYSRRGGGARLREAGRLWTGKAGVDAAPGCTAVFPGVQSAISAALLSLFGFGDVLAVDEFTYGNLISLARLAKIRLAPVPGDGGGMSPDALDRLAAGGAAKGVFLMPDCANPTAVRMGPRRRRELAEVARRRNLIVLEDSAALDSGAVAPVQSFAPERTIYLSGTSRLLSSGLRAAFVAFPPSARDRLLSGLHHTAIKASALDAGILGELVLGGAADAILARKRKAATLANAAFAKAFSLRPTKDDFRLFRTVPVPQSKTPGAEIERRLAESGVAACHSDRFRAGRRPAAPFLRVSVSNAPGRSALARDLAALKSALRIAIEIGQARQSWKDPERPHTRSFP